MAHLCGDHIIGLETLDDANNHIVIIDANGLGKVSRIGNDAFCVHCLQHLGLHFCRRRNCHPCAALSQDKLNSDGQIIALKSMLIKNIFINSDLPPHLSCTLVPSQRNKSVLWIRSSCIKRCILSNHLRFIWWNRRQWQVRACSAG